MTQSVASRAEAFKDICTSLDVSWDSRYREGKWVVTAKTLDETEIKVTDKVLANAFCKLEDRLR